jgi:alpha-L-rhamnosidase
MKLVPISQWIGADSDSKAAPLFRRYFSIDRTVTSATLSLCGLGYHEIWINGERVGDHVLDPAQTDYEKRVLYVVHDVTDLIQRGPNALGVILGNGWYNQDRVWSRRKTPYNPDHPEPGPPEMVTGLSYGQPRLLAEIFIEFRDGTKKFIRADENWRCAPGPITANNIYAGECYDARREIEGWCAPIFDDLAWQRAVRLPAPGGELQEQTMPPMRKIEELRPVAITAMEAGRYVVDMGQNFSGWARIKLAAPAGTEIAMRFAEELGDDGNVDTASTGVFATTVEQIDLYICRGEGEETWEPRFTYHGFRYVEVTGWPGVLTADAITGVVVHTDLPVAGAFECSDARLNQLHQMARWTLRSNLHGIPEDCPARERCGWLGDANLIAEYSMWNYDAKLFWEKYLGDIETTRAGNGGIPCDIAPGKRATQGNANPDWAATFIVLPWTLYRQYGDRKVLAKHWKGTTQLMDHFAGAADGWILPGGYGDFFDPGTDAIVMHTPQTLSTSLWFYRCAEIMAAVAVVLKKPDAAEQYRNWSKSIAAAVTERYYDRANGTFGSQGANVLALAFGIMPEEDEERILAALVADIQARDSHMNVGVMGVRFILEVLTRGGHGELALALMHQNSYPSFGHLIERGATTLWECWGEAEHNGTHGARSLSHPFMGGFDNWFFNTLAGIRGGPDRPGFKHVVLEPHPIAGLDWVRGHYDAAHGRIESNWRCDGDTFEWDVKVPARTTATATLPFSRETIELKKGTHHFVDENLHRTVV